MTPLHTKRKSVFQEESPAEDDSVMQDTVTLPALDAIKQFALIHNGHLFHSGESVYTSPNRRYLISILYSRTCRDTLVAKFFDTTSHTSELSLRFFCVQRQYRQWQKLYSTHLPFAIIHNIDSLQQDGYILQETLIPFTKDLIPWNAQTDRFSVHMQTLLHHIKQLFQDTFIKSALSGLDLKWSNLGVRADNPYTVVLIDPSMQDRPFYENAHLYLYDLSQRNLAVQQYLLEGLYERCQHDSHLLQQMHNLAIKIH